MGGCYSETRKNEPFEFNVEHIFGWEAHGEVLELRGI